MKAWLVLIGTALSAMAGGERALFTPVASGAGIAPCKHWPWFDVYNYNSNSKSYMRSFGLEDMNDADVTIVGLYIADDKPSQNKAIRHADLKKTLDNIEISKGSQKQKIKANVAAISYFSPLKCVEKTCMQNQTTATTTDWATTTTDWLSSWFGYDNTDPCYDTIGGCPTGYFGGEMDSDLLEKNWQAKLASNLPAYMPILQDLDYLNVWDSFGGQDGDLFVYDKTGRLYAYICTNANICDHPIPGNTIAVQSGFDYVLEIAKEAAKSNGTVRCKKYIDAENDDLPTDYNYNYYSWNEGSVEEGKANERPEQDDDWMDGYSKSAAASKKSAGTDAIGNTHPSDSTDEKKSGTIPRGATPTISKKSGTFSSATRPARAPPGAASYAGFYILFVLVVLFMVWRYRRYKMMQEDAAGSYTSLHNNGDGGRLMSLPPGLGAATGSPGKNPSSKNYGGFSEEEERATLL